MSEEEKRPGASPGTLAEALRLVLEAHREWVESTGARGQQLDLSGADLAGADFHGAKFSGANLQGACFDMANMKDTAFAGADFHGAEFDDLTGAKFKRAELTGRSHRRKDWRTLDPRKEGNCIGQTHPTVGRGKGQVIE